MFFKWLGTTVWNNCQLWIVSRYADAKAKIYKEQYYVVAEDKYFLKVITWKTIRQFNACHARKVKYKKFKKGRLEAITLYKTR